MKKVALISFMIVLFTACSTTYPAVTQYRIAPKESAKKEHFSTECKAKTLKISQVFVKNSLMGKEMKYIVGDYKEYAYNQSEWAEHPNKAISDVIINSLQRSNIFSHVSGYKSFTVSDYTLESNIAEFTQHFSEDEQHSFAKIDITFSLIDNSSVKIVASKHIVKSMPVAEANAQSGVVALNRLLESALDEMKLWIAKACK